MLWFGNKCHMYFVVMFTINITTEYEQTFFCYCSTNSVNITRVLVKTVYQEIVFMSMFNKIVIDFYGINYD